MATKLKTPIDHLSKADRAVKAKRMDGVKLPDGLAKTTRSALRKGSFQERLLALFAPSMGAELLASLRRGLQADEPDARKLSAEILRYTSKQGIHVNVNQTNQTANVGRGSREEQRESMSFEEIARSVHEGRQRKALLPPAEITAQFVATPEE